MCCTDVPGLKAVHFNYQLGSKAKSVLPESGKAARGGKGIDFEGPGLSNFAHCIIVII